MEGIFTISLDFELHWGTFDKRDRMKRKTCYLNTIKLIPELLKLFNEFDVHVTWATVGSLLAGTRDEWERLKPSILPVYDNAAYSAYEWVKENGIENEHYWAHFAPECVESIIQYPGQELGTHTFGHYYCLEPQEMPEAFVADLDAFVNAAKKYSQEPVSLVFPRNQFNRHFLKVCYEKGIRTVRSNPKSWFWTPIPDGNSSLLRKVFRTGDAYLKMGKRTSYPLSEIEVVEDEPIMLPASRLLRSWHPKYQVANKLKLQRVLHELRMAAYRRECYHLWWHPENFGDYPDKNLEELRIILTEFRRCKNKYGMTSWNMGEYAQNLNC